MASRMPRTVSNCLEFLLDVYFFEILAVQASRNLPIESQYSANADHRKQIYTMQWPSSMKILRTSLHPLCYVSDVERDV